jgi:large-conductance mechanosensitive channel
MYELILQIILMLSLAAIVYLMALAVPRLEETEKKKNSNGNASLPLEKLDTLLDGVKDKLLRRLKVVVMRTDNFISKQLNNKKEKL